MYFQTLTVLLFVALLNTEANVIKQKLETCEGGYCLPKHLCPTGRFNDEPILGENRLTTLRVDEENECGDFMKICCKVSNTDSENQSVTDKCGISNPEGLVYNVESNLTYAKYAEFPWTVAIFVKYYISRNLKLTHVGGGTLIHPKYALTTAHTVAKIGKYMARFGEWNMKSDAEIYPSQDIDIEKRILHPSYREALTTENDIALVVLKDTVLYSEHIRPLCLPNALDSFDGKRCIATGWGLDIRTEQPAPIMKRMELNVIPREHCRTMFWNQGFKFELHSSFMCVEPAGEQNSCFKDGGSPLACQREDGSYVMAGITSWVLDCGRSEIPGAQVDVAQFSSWINEIIDAQNDSDESYEINALSVDDEVKLYAYLSNKNNKG
ncbi:inactive CLIP domain-containing serine protease A8-like [Anopheles moucheti]|uniref:inactive CLIP domain-containing serine protease A8-like n=1 Tax=Anopheles moucheti TaxID=186751 RepID=UPI0022F0BD4B|nr:inactive CLIP domain-containing serine protease A8-like [Anopheles moucheti]